MFEISDLKSKKLPELQEIAKELNVPKFKTLKKLDLVYQILDYQAANPEAVKANVSSDKDNSETKANKPQQKRTRPEKKPQNNKDQKTLEFSDKKEDNKPQERKSNNDRSHQKRHDNKSNERKDDNKRSNPNQNDNRQNRSKDNRNNPNSKNKCSCYHQHDHNAG